MVNDKLERGEKAIDLAVGYRLNCVSAGKRQPWTRKRIDLAFGGRHITSELNYSTVPDARVTAQVKHVWRVLEFKGWQTAGLDAQKKLYEKPLMCGLGVAVGCRMKHAKSAFEGF